MELQRLEKCDLRGFESKAYKRTELSTLIVSNWFSTVEELAQRSKVGYDNIVKALNGEVIPQEAERKLREFFKKGYTVENTCVCCGAVIPEGRQVCLNCLIEHKE